MAGPFYVEPGVGNDGNDGLSWGADHAWATTQKAADTVAAGETCYFRGTETLSATELREFHWLLRSTAYGPRAAWPYGRYYNDGRLRGFGNRWPAARGGRGGFGRGIPMRGARGYAGRGVPMRGMRGGLGWNTRPGRYPDGLEPEG